MRSVQYIICIETGKLSIFNCRHTKIFQMKQSFNKLNGRRLLQTGLMTIWNWYLVFRYQGLIYYHVSVVCVCSMFYRNDVMVDGIVNVQQTDKFSLSNQIFCINSKQTMCDINFVHFSEEVAHFHSVAVENRELNMIYYASIKAYPDKL